MMIRTSQVWGIIFSHFISQLAEDGVRLGCYGHEQNGRMYSTHYVADGKGYRLVPHQGLITVYPKDGGEPRKASFVDAFKEEEIQSSNIRYFFPEGCKAPEIMVQPIEYKPVERVRTTEFNSATPNTRLNSADNQNIRGSRRRTVPSSRNPKNVQEENLSDPIALPKPAIFYVPISENNPLNVEPLATNTNEEKPLLEEQKPVKNSDANDLKSKVTTTDVDSSKNLFTPVINAPFKNIDDRKCSDTCCDDNRPQILMSRASPNSCCKGVSKIVIPIEMEILSKITTSEIVEISNETDSKMMLVKLLNLLEKYEV